MHLLDGLAHEDIAQRTLGHPEAPRLNLVFDSTPGRAEGSRPCDLDLVKLRPILARDEQALRGGVVRDAVQDRLAAARALRIERAQVDEAEHLAVGWRDARDAIVVPDVRPDLAID